jgi:hypothetical protein
MPQEETSSLACLLHRTSEVFWEYLQKKLYCALGLRSFLLLKIKTQPKSMQLNARSVCVLASVFSIMSILFLRLGFSYDGLLLIVSSLSTLYFFNSRTVLAEAACESTEKILLGKQIRAINWKILYNRAAYLARMRDALRPKAVKTRPRGDTCATQTKKNEVMGGRRWKSWSGSVDSIIPCNSTEMERTISS